eukprot:6658963-Lingulodinium_polyedra.AAC.1
MQCGASLGKLRTAHPHHFAPGRGRPCRGSTGGASTASARPSLCLARSGASRRPVLRPTSRSSRRATSTSTWRCAQ